MSNAESEFYDMKESFREHMMVKELRLQCNFAMYAYHDYHQTLDALDDWQRRREEALSHLLGELPKQEHEDARIAEEGAWQDGEGYRRERELHERVFYNMHGFLTHSGNISKLLWPISQKYRTRGEWLRKAFKVQDAPPLKSREIRNDLEHYDERLELWLSDIRRLTQTDLIIGIVHYPERPENIHRQYDYDSEIFSYQGKGQNLNDIAQEISRIQREIELWNELGMVPPTRRT
ncbi:MAG TPA: hypothetical protein VF826_10245 [Chloroflexia bacterium]|jgi:hypothetical protein